MTARAGEPGDLRPYRRDLPYGYSVGTFATLELLRHRPERALRVLCHSRLPDGRRARLVEAGRRAGVPLDVDDHHVERLRRKDNVYCLGVFAKAVDPLSGGDHVVLVEPAGFGNVGTIARTMLAFGVRDLALVGDVDPHNPHLIRASVGASFALRCEGFADLDAYLARFHRPLHLFAAGAASPLEAVRFGRPAALVFGPEGPGLSDALLARGTPVAIPHSALVESLNLAVAAGIALHHLHRRRDRPAVRSGPPPP